MTIPNNEIEKLIKEIKKNSSLDGVRFVKAYKGRKADSPVEGLLVTVALGEEIGESFFGGYMANEEKGERIKSDLLLNVYCPYKNGGEGITEVVNLILEGLKQSQGESLVSSVTVSEIKLSREYEAVYRTIKIALDYVA
jgi:hypothetical protein